MTWQASNKIDRSVLHYTSDNQFMLSYCQTPALNINAIRTKFSPISPVERIISIP
ncbi:hypothetical protein BH11BAC7_BH11BAC7_34190 [soil metagenome]